MSTVRPAALDRYGPLIEARLKRAVGERAALLAQMLRHQLGWTDRAGLPGSSAPDRPHGVLCLLAAEAADGPRDAAITAAAAIELVRGFYRVHRDLREGDPGLPDSPALWWTWGYAQGINAGDALYAQARLALMEATEDGLSPEAVLDACLILDRGCLDLALAQHTLIEIEEQDRPDPAGYTQAVERTDGRLAATAAALGAAVAGAGERDRDAAGRAGTCFGAAWRLRAELDGLTVGGRTAAIENIRNGRTLPVIFALANAAGADLDAIERVRAHDGPLTDGDVDAAVAAIERCGARTHVEELIDGLTREGEAALAASAFSSEGAGAITALGRYVAQPRRTGGFGTSP